MSEEDTCDGVEEHMTTFGIRGRRKSEASTVHKCWYTGLCVCVECYGMGC